MDAPLLQTIQQSGRILGRWPVIKGQCQIHRLRRSRSRQRHAPVRSRHSTSRGRIRFIASPKQNMRLAESAIPPDAQRVEKVFFATLRHFSELQKL